MGEPGTDAHPKDRTGGQAEQECLKVKGKYKRCGWSPEPSGHTEVARGSRQVPSSLASVAPSVNEGCGAAIFKEGHLSDSSLCQGQARGQKAGGYLPTKEAPLCLL